MSKSCLLLRCWGMPWVSISSICDRNEQRYLLDDDIYTEFIVPEAQATKLNMMETT